MTVSPPREGQHLIADLAGCSRLDDAAWIERCLTEAAAAAGATLLEVRLHAFGAGQGVTGVALLAESHISIHSWPEYGTACVDIFMCGRPDGIEAALETIVAMLGGRVTHRTLLARRYAGLLA
ncbi:adenosylmethionine decarboxylase [Sphingomonas canadensis]|uniref:Adenosylmethionine decarboxylase n=1 Tax=Sphingomonas canadensis TaxID=1219257 RepID=A0ABW3HBE4_9SPHN|nr:adenosylmethionine decarboxylase [Sphingomonas canadensis]MCW3838252.1 adenosylmethionine decarboxylase [Sphingomonas canadensis]